MIIMMIILIIGLLCEIALKKKKKASSKHNPEAARPGIEQLASGSSLSTQGPDWKRDFQDRAQTLRSAVKWLLCTLTLQAPAVGSRESLKQSPSLLSSL